MDEDPHVNFFPWEMDIHDTAAGMATSLHPLGLLSAVLTDEQWATYPGNTFTDANGQDQVRARFAPPALIQENDQMTNVELYVARVANAAALINALFSQLGGLELQQRSLAAQSALLDAQGSSDAHA